MQIRLSTNQIAGFAHLHIICMARKKIFFQIRMQSPDHEKPRISEKTGSGLLYKVKSPGF